VATFSQAAISDSNSAAWLRIAEIASAPSCKRRGVVSASSVRSIAFAALRLCADHPPGCRSFRGQTRGSGQRRPGNRQ
jgi:hypothetical protein